MRTIIKKRNNILKRATALKDEKLKDIVRDLYVRNPYPIDVFSEPTNKEWITLKRILLKRRITQDKYFASMGRLAYLAAVENLLSLIEEIEKGEPQNNEKTK
jgi:hypothetical protein